MDRVLLCLVVVGLVSVQAQSVPTTMVLSGIIRDQAPDTLITSPTCRGTPGTANGGLGFSGTDFELPVINSFEQRLVKATLGADDTPEYAYNGTSPLQSVTSPASFYTWFHNSPQTINIPIDLTLSLVPGSSVYQYNNLSFFPIDGKGWKDSCTVSSYVNGTMTRATHNFGFCMEIHSRFVYKGGEVFNFLGDDDVWVFINRKLVVDLGGLHPRLSASVSLDTLGLVRGNVYPFDFFYCERHTIDSNLQISTSLSFFCAYYDWCGVCEGNGQSCCTSQLCDDNNACTVDKCPVQVAPTNQTCVHTPVSCPAAPDACSIAGCLSTTGCYMKPKNCNDGNACTIDTCDAVTGCRNSPLNCNDNNACTADQCNTATGCQSTPITCNDNNACTSDSCSSSSGCAYTPISCPAPNKCQTSACDRIAGCLLTPITCNDNNACTSDSCNATSGCSFTPVSCPAPNKCYTSACNPNAGCLLTPITCNDNNACTIDSCDASVGCVFTPRQCNDGNACTSDTCDAATGCRFSSISCDDANACTQDTCNTTTGCSFTPRQCNDGNACTLDTCDRTKGCQFSALSCDDSNACTVDSCSNTTGCVRFARQCNDGNLCTVDTCDAITGCKFVPFSCDDSNPCTLDSCNPTTGKCARTPLSCDDGNACTLDSCAATGTDSWQCVHTPLHCDDGNACTSDCCDALTGCSFTPLSCNDGNDCTSDTCNTTSGCINKPISCDDGSACTVDSCDRKGGCRYTNVTCANSGAVTCATTSCSASTGCQYSPIVDAVWENVLQDEWVDDNGPHSDWTAVLKTGSIPLRAVTFRINPQVTNLVNANPIQNGLYSLPSSQYLNGVVPAYSSYVTFSYTIDGFDAASIALSSEICSSQYTGCSVHVKNQLVSSWTSTTGATIGQYNIYVTNIGTQRIGHVNVTIAPPSGVIENYWNMNTYAAGKFKCDLWSLAPGYTSQTCGYIIRSTSALPLFDFVNVNPLCV